MAQPAADKKPDQASPRSPAIRPGERLPGGPGPGPRLGGGFERIFAVLTEEQRASFRRAMEGQRESARRLEEKSAEARRELFEAALVDKFAEARVREKVKALADVDADLTMIRIGAFSKIEPSLSAQQLEKLRNPGAMDSGDAPEPARKRRPEVPRDEHRLPIKSSTEEKK
jgi:Spy/CpxP family protein refolding chaperone